MRKLLCTLIVLAVGTGYLAAAEIKQSIMLDKSYPAQVLRVDNAKHMLWIRWNGPDGKFSEKALSFPSTIVLSDFKPGVKYTFFEHAGKVIAVQPFTAPPIAKTPVLPATTKPVTPPAQPLVKVTAPKVTPPKLVTPPAQPVVKATIPPTAPKLVPPLNTAIADARKAEQAKFAAVSTLQNKTEAYQFATTKFEAAKRFMAAADQAVQYAKTWMKQNEAAKFVTETRILHATVTADHANAMANLAEARVALAQADAMRAKAYAKVATAELALAKVESGNIAKVKAFAIGFEKSKEAAAKTAHTQYFEAKALMDKTFQERQTAQQFVQKLTMAFEKAQAYVTQIRKEMTSVPVKVAPKKMEKPPVKH